MSENWRPETSGYDYFQHQQKKNNLADRRPVIRKASDLVGPGIGANAVRLADYNDVLATFNGYFSSVPGASNAPNATEAFVGYVVSDSALGGTQVFTSLATRVEYRRTFTRSPIDPAAIGWGSWSGVRVLPSLFSMDAANPPAITVPAGARVTLDLPTLTSAGNTDGVYETSSVGVRIRTQGIYTGVIEVGNTPEAVVNTAMTLFLTMPNGSSTVERRQIFPSIYPSLLVPFTVRANNSQQAIAVDVLHNNATSLDLWMRIQITRVGDAI